MGTATMDAKGIATLTTSFSKAGTHSIKAGYIGNGTFAGSISKALSETVN